MGNYKLEKFKEKKMEKLHESRACKDDEKCCKVVEIPTGSKVVGVIDILVFVMCLLGSLKVIYPQTLLESVAPAIDEISSSFRLLYWFGTFIYLFRSVIFLWAIKDPQAEKVEKWYK